MADDLKVFFSVIIPTFNRASTVERAINSALKQTYTEFEIIVVDDFSTDNTLQVIEEFNNPRIICTLNKHKKGACGARNTGAEMSKGTWLAFLDSDDYWKPEKLFEVQKAITLSDFKAFYSGYESNELVDGVPFVKRTGHSGMHLDELYFKNTIGGLSVFVVYKAAFESVGWFDEEFNSKQDLDLYIRLAKHIPFGFIETPLVYLYREETNRISLSKKSRVTGWLSFYKKYNSELSIHARFYHSKRILFLSVTNRYTSAVIKFSCLFIVYGVLNFFIPRKSS